MAEENNPYQSPDSVLAEELEVVGGSVEKGVAGCFGLLSVTGPSFDSICKILGLCADSRRKNASSRRSIPFR